MMLNPRCPANGAKDFPAPFGGNLPQRLSAQALFKWIRFIIHHSAFFISS
jgi:hypothetical protein